MYETRILLILFMAVKPMVYSYNAKMYVCNTHCAHEQYCTSQLPIFHHLKKTFIRSPTNTNITLNTHTHNPNTIKTTQHNPELITYNTEHDTKL